MSTFAVIASYLAGGFLAIQVVTSAICAWRCRRGALSRAPAEAPPITLVRPLCGLESHSQQTLRASFLIDYPDYQLIFCVACADDPIVPMVRSAIVDYPQVPARLLIGDDDISDNPKLNNMTKGWRAATTDHVVFADSNLLTPPDYLSRLVALWDKNTGLVSAPPIGAPADDFGSEVECAFLNSYQARWQYAVDAFGFGFAQGKTLFYRRSLIPGGVEALATEAAEDAASTKIIREAGLHVRLARPPFLQPLGRRRLVDVWSRQLRWSRLRRATFPMLFAPEILTGLLPPLVCLVVAAAFGAATPLVILPYVLVWYGSEALLNLACGWATSWRTAAAFVLRDILIPALWIGGLAGTGFEWKGQTLRTIEAPQARRRPQTLMRFSPIKARAKARRRRSLGSAYEHLLAHLPSAGRASARVASAMKRMRDSSPFSR